AVTQLQIEHTKVAPGAEGFGLEIPERKRNWRGRFSGNLFVLEGGAAKQALQKILPRVNRQGGARLRAKEGGQVVWATPTAESLGEQATAARGRYWKESQKQGYLQRLEPAVRLALEMGAHEDAERRWLAGELLELEEAWRAAEELAAIADKLGVPEDVEARLA